MINMTFESSGTSADYHFKEESGIVLTPESKVSFELSDDVYDEEGH